MNTVGLVTEYNPFHRGHKYHIRAAKEQTHSSFAIVVMSGNFVQRGAPAILDKYTRTHMALLEGADMVFELPVAYSLSSAENFAFGTVSILNQLEFINSLCFGSECGSLDQLIPFSRLFQNEPKEYKELLVSSLKTGLSFPAARQKAALTYLQLPDDEILSNPNNLLGIEYLKALDRLDSTITPSTIARVGHHYHDDTISKATAFCSATSIRKQMHAQDNWQSFLPELAGDFIASKWNVTFPIETNDFSSYLYYALLANRENLTDYLDVSEDLANRIEHHLAGFQTVEQFAQLIGTKQYTNTRINRCLYQILLSIKKREVQPPFLRLLGMRKNASFLLSQKDIITNLSKASLTLPTSDLLASDLYQHVIQDKFGTKLPNEYQRSPIVF